MSVFGLLGAMLVCPGDAVAVEYVRERIAPNGVFWVEPMAINGDGRHVLLVAGGGDPLPTGLYALDTVEQVVEELTRHPDGWSPTDAVRPYNATSDLRFVAFRAEWDAYVPEDTNSDPDTYLIDRESGEVHWLSVEPDGDWIRVLTPSGITEDGRELLAGSLGGSLPGGASCSIYDIGAREWGPAVVDPDFGTADCSPLAPMELSVDGRYVGFSTMDDLLGRGDDVLHTYRHDRLTGETELVDETRRGRGSPSAEGSHFEDMTPDGRYVVFRSRSPDIVWGDLIPAEEEDAENVFVRDMELGVTIRVDQAPGRADPMFDDCACYDESPYGMVAPNGMAVAFSSHGENIAAGDTNDRRDVFVRRVDRRKTWLVSRDWLGRPLLEDSRLLGVFDEAVYFETEAAVLPDDLRGRDMETHVVREATCRGVPATILGTYEADVLVGTPGPDVILGLAGDDRIDGGGGDDIICGGEGEDELTGGTGDDWVQGGWGDDTLHGGPGVDRLDGGPGDDTLLGDEDDRCEAGWLEPDAPDVCG